MNPDAYLRFYGNKFLAAVEGYSDAVAMGYLRAIWHYIHHLHAGGIPNDDDYMRRVCHVERTEWARTKGIIFDGDKFFALCDGRWHQKFAAQDYAEVCEAYRKTCEASRLGVLARQGKQPAVEPPVAPPVEPKVGIPVAPMVNQSESESTYSTDIYNAYPRKVGRPAALKAIARALKTISPADLFAKTQAYARATAGKDPQFIPHPATWFNQQRFNDDPATWAPQPAKPAGETAMGGRQFAPGHKVW